VAAVPQPKSFPLEQGTVAFQLPAGWEHETDVFGTPLVLLGPVKDEQRSVISVVPSGLEVDFAKELGKTEYEYRLGRRQYLETVGAELVKFRDYEKTKLNGNEAHVMGVRYRTGGVEMAETSYYVLCQKKMYFLKTLTRDAGEERAVSDVAQSFRCQ
jgi:hypothetical protein